VHTNYMQILCASPMAICGLRAINTTPNWYIYHKRDGQQLLYTSVTPTSDQESSKFQNSEVSLEITISCESWDRALE
jgi:hypothetical protein